MNDSNDYGNRDYSVKGTTEMNAGYYAASALQIRLDTSQVVRQVEMYLRGERSILTEDVNGMLVKHEIWKGKPLVSDEGLQGIMQFIEIVFNPQVVQGNFSDVSSTVKGYDLYAEYLCRTRKDLAEHLMKNINNYGIDEKNFNGIISTIMRFVEAFMTRLLYNKERDSYANTIKTLESTQTSPQRSGLKIPFFG